MGSIILIDSATKWPTSDQIQVFQPVITCLNLTIETLEQDAKYVQS